MLKYFLSKNMSQILIAEYKLKLIDKKLLESKLREFNDLVKTMEVE